MSLFMYDITKLFLFSVTFSSDSPRPNNLRAVLRFFTRLPTASVFETAPKGIVCIFRQVRSQERTTVFKFCVSHLLTPIRYTGPRGFLPLKSWPNAIASSRKLNLRGDLQWVAKRTRSCTCKTPKISFQGCI